jgi:hypothetical protein
VWQPQLLDASGDVNSQLLARHTTPLVFSSLVLKTKQGSFIQVWVGGGGQGRGREA